MIEVLFLVKKDFKVVIIVNEVVFDGICKVEVVISKIE